MQANSGTGTESTATRQPRQHLLDFDRDAIAIDQHHAARDRQAVGENLDLVRLGGVQFDDGAAAKPHYLMDWHRGGAEDHHQIDTVFIEGWHCGPGRRDKREIPSIEITTLWIADG